MIDSDVKRIEGKCDEMSRTLTEVRDWQIRFDGRADLFDRDIKELRDEVFGNGDPGLKARLQRQEDQCKAQLAAKSGIKMFLGRVSQTVVAVVIVAVIFWLMGIFKTGQ